MTTDMHKPLAATFAMMKGGGEVHITFPTDMDRRLFQEGLRIADECAIIPIGAWKIIYRGAARTLTEVRRIDCMDFYMHRIKGIVSPSMAILAVRGEDVADDVPLAVTYVWLRHSQNANREEGWGYCVEDGNPSGKGGSYRGTIIASPRDIGMYSVKVERKPPQVYRTTECLLNAWELFCDRVEAGTL